jgi:hypothetical protein
MIKHRKMKNVIEYILLLYFSNRLKIKSTTILDSFVVLKLFCLVLIISLQIEAIIEKRFPIACQFQELN